MTKWIEAEFDFGWGSRWPDDAEYFALREAKRLLDSEGPSTEFCNCGEFGCSHQSSHVNYRTVQIRDAGETGGGHWLGPVASVWRSSGNRYGYGSDIYKSDHTTQILMRWKGVPLKAGDPPVIMPTPMIVQPRTAHIHHRDRVYHHPVAEQPQPHQPAARVDQWTLIHHHHAPEHVTLGQAAQASGTQPGRLTGRVRRKGGGR